MIDDDEQKLKMMYDDVWWCMMMEQWLCYDGLMMIDERRYKGEYKMKQCRLMIRAEQKLVLKICWYEMIQWCNDDY